jgi:uncharacterized hydrophobic protein (TIGR00341 family)
MALRLLQTHVPADLAASAEAALEEASAKEVWTETGGPMGCIVSAVVGSGATGAAIDLLHDRLRNVGGFRILVLPLDAVLPRPEASLSVEHRESATSSAAVSREEVYASISDGSKLSLDFLALTVLATVVAAVGLTQNNVAAIIGAMVVAPLLGPNIALALGLTLADAKLTRDAIWTSVAGFGAAFATSLLMGIGLDVDPSIPEIGSRTALGLGDMLLALAAGCAGTLAFTTGTGANLVGVMVAVALLPPTVACGLLLGDGYPKEAGGAFVLVFANVIAVILAGMATFLWKGMRPRHWWLEDRASKRARIALGVFVGLFIALGAVVVASQHVLPPAQ